MFLVHYKCTWAELVISMATNVYHFCGYSKKAVGMASAGASGSSTMTPAASRMLQRKWDERRLQEHRERLRKVRASVDNGPPRDFVHLRQNLRKRQIEEDRWRTVDRHNRELLTRMHHIMQSTGRVEHRNLDWKPKKSLNYIKRQKEMSRTQRENQAILKRIQTVKPQYNVKQWESEYHTHMTRTKNISTLPPLEPRVLTHKHREERRREDITKLPPIQDFKLKAHQNEADEIDVER